MAPGILELQIRLAMRQVLHLLVVDRHRATALACQFGARWLLPIVTCAERRRAGPIAAQWCQDRGIAAHVAGLWLGRIGPEATDWLTAIDATTEWPAAPPGLAWTPLDALHASSAIVEFQSCAIGRSVRHSPVPSVPGPFGDLGWHDRVRRWIGAWTGEVPASLTPYRAGPHEVVAGADAPGGRVFFKGLTADRASEINVTRMLSAVAPDAFAQTLAVDHRADGSRWWLTAGCPGEPVRDAHAAAAALARIQQRVSAASAAAADLPALDLAAVIAWAADLAGAADAAARLRRCGDVVAGANVPRSWIPMDLDPSNMLVDHDGRTRFIDADDSYLGPAPLALALFAPRCRDCSIHATYEQSWDPPVANPDWRAFEVVATAIELWQGWTRVQRGIERGDVSAVADVIANRIRERLVRAIYRR
jgi:hypothetical protein